MKEPLDEIESAGLVVLVTTCIIALMMCGGFIVMYSIQKMANTQVKISDNLAIIAMEQRKGYMDIVSTTFDTNTVEVTGECMVYQSHTWCWHAPKPKPEIKSTIQIRGRRPDDAQWFDDSVGHGTRPDGK